MHNTLIKLKNNVKINKKLYIIDDRNPELKEVLEERADDLSTDLALTILNVEDVKVQNTFVSEITTSSSMVGKGIPFNVEVLVQNEGEVIATINF